MSQQSPAGAWASGHLARGRYGLLPLHHTVAAPAHCEPGHICAFHAGLAWFKKHLLAYFPERKDYPLDWQEQEGWLYLQGYLSFIAQNRFHLMHQAPSIRHVSWSTVR